MGRPSSIKTKKQQCKNFLWVICVGGILIPLVFHAFLYGEFTAIILITALLTAVTPTLFASFSYFNYDAATSRKRTASPPVKEPVDKEKRGDHLLYIGGILSILFIAVYIGLSGGIKENIMAYYFVFIPSATAVAFRTRKGLWYISVTAIICLVVLYCFFYGQEIVEESLDFILFGLVIPNRVLYLVFSVYQICLIVLLEYLTNKLPA